MPRRPPPPPDPREVRFVARLDLPPFDSVFWPPRRGRGDPVFTRRVEADRLSLWLACSRALCRSARHCVGTSALCVFEQDDVKRPLLE
jgi:hypothetical protein